MMNDGLAAVAVLVLFLDNSRPIAGLTLLDDGCTVMVAIPVMTFTHCHARTHWTDANADIVGQCWSGESSHSRNYQSIFHDVFSLFKTKRKSRALPKVPAVGELISLAGRPCFSSRHQRLLQIFEAG
jgi:hypothetical protein